MRASAMPFYYGWILLAAAALSELLAQGAAAYSAGLFVLPLQAEFHLSRADANSPVLILFLGAALFAPFTGRLLDHCPVRLSVPVGAVLFGGALASIALVSSLWVMVLLLLIPAAIGFMLVGSLTTAMLAVRWFVRHRGLALGIAAIATSGGGLIVTPVLARAIAAHGWRWALFHEGIVMTAIIAILAVCFLRDTPAAVGLSEHVELQGGSVPTTVHPPWHQILTRRVFWLPTLGIALISGTSQALVVTLVPYGVSLGLSAVAASSFIAVFAAAAALTKVAAGILADRLPLRWLMVAALLFMLASQLTLAVAAGRPPLLAASALAGVAMGCALPVSAGQIAQAFGAQAFGTVMGWTYLVIGLAVIAATRFIGAVFDTTHGYGAAFITFLVLAGTVFAATLLLGRRTA